MPDTKVSDLAAATSPLAAADVIYVVQGGASKKATVADIALNAPIEFQDEGTGMGAAGTVDEVDFVGAGVSAARAGNKVTVTIPGGGGSTPTGDGYRHITAGVEDAAARGIERSVAFLFDGDGEVLLAGPEARRRLEFGGVIDRWSITEVSDTPISTTTVVDIWADTDANYPPTVADTIAGTEKPTLTAATNNEDTTLTTWTPGVLAGDWLTAKLESNNNAKKILVIIYIIDTGA